MYLRCVNIVIQIVSQNCRFRALHGIFVRIFFIFLFSYYIRNIYKITYRNNKDKR